MGSFQNTTGRRSRVRARRSGRAGQAYLETFFAVLMISLLFFGLFQLSLLFNAREVLFHAAHRAARARAVGFNQWMVTKVMRVGAIPNAGAMREPSADLYESPLVDAVRTMSPGALWDLALDSSPPSAKAAIERARIPDYLAGPHAAITPAILDYAEWPNIRLSGDAGLSSGDGTLVPPVIRTTVTQNYPLLIAMHRLFYAPAADGDGIARVRLAGRVEIENHHALYLDDQNW